ncbi:hypothetical protein C8R43DRAFT_1100787 [Mycena crocata]|nr:hypothetical protein C8R43DRAFT_1100787 [Mycena crocata]
MDNGARFVWPRLRILICNLYAMNLPWTQLTDFEYLGVDLFALWDAMPPFAIRATVDLQIQLRLSQRNEILPFTGKLHPITYDFGALVLHLVADDSDITRSVLGEIFQNATFSHMHELHLYPGVKGASVGWPHNDFIDLSSRSMFPANLTFLVFQSVIISDTQLCEILPALERFTIQNQFSLASDPLFLPHIYDYVEFSTHLPLLLPPPTMNDAEKASEHEAAAAKLWAVYVSEAEKYDKGLVESWKSDMEGILIFAGLFSASVTAFLIESYKTLLPDPADKTVLLLEQISQQLSAAANGTKFTITSSAPFTALPTSVVCNLLWFISLGLALTSALIATLVEQWARDFLHRAEMRSAPIIRARVFSFLYYGLKRFKMHTIVELIPLLLHASLILFFAGLVSFLSTVNTPATAITAFLLFIVTAVYSVLTILPLRHLDSPYRTPLSGAFWRLQRIATSLYPRGHSAVANKESHSRIENATIIDSIFLKATETSKDRTVRDERALIWTVKSLTDNAELEPFIEALPDVLWGLNERRYIYDDHIRELVNNPDVRLHSRIMTLYTSSYSGLLSRELAIRRRISCYKAIWAVGSLSLPTAPFGPYASLPALAPRSSFPQEDEEAASYREAARAMIDWENLHAAQAVLKEASKLLAGMRSLYSTADNPLESCLRKLPTLSDPNPWSRWEMAMNSLSISAMTKPFNLSTTRELLEQLEELSHIRPLQIFMSYLYRISALKSPPYQLQNLCQTLSPPRLPLAKDTMMELRSTLNGVVDDLVARPTQTRTREETPWWNILVPSLITYWNPVDGGIAFPESLLRYMNRGDATIWNNFYSNLPAGAWPSIATTFIDKPMTGPGVVSTPSPELPLTFLWKLVETSCRFSFTPSLASLQAILEAVSDVEPSAMKQAVLAFLKWKFLETIFSEYWETALPDRMIRFWHPIFPENTAVDDANERLSRGQNQFRSDELGRVPDAFVPASHPAREYPLFITQRLNEGLLQIMTELINSCVSNNLPSLVPETLGWIENCSMALHFLPRHQMDFAISVKNLFDAWAGEDNEDALKILHTVPNLGLFHAYGYGMWKGESESRPFAWLDNPQARDVIKETFTAYLVKLSATEHTDVSQDFQQIVSNLEAIVTGLDALHFVR